MLHIKEIFKSKTVRKIVGVVFVVIGIISIITPFTPAGALFFIGLEILGIRFLFWDKIKRWFK
jgi:hypothetical protein